MKATPQIEPAHPSSTTEAPLPSLRSLAPLLLLESLFTLVGGFTDAYAYIAHNRVFANAQTGNVVLLAVDLAQHDAGQALQHLPPILAAGLGVTAAKLLGARSTKRTYTATLLCQAVEIAVFALLLAFPDRVPRHLVIPAISFAAALQISSFDMLGPWSFNTAMTTGNLKSAIVGLVLWLKGEDPARHRGQLVVSTVACLAFFSGALFGALHTRAHPSSALFPCLLLLLAAFALTWREHSRAHLASTPNPFA